MENIETRTRLELLAKLLHANIVEVNIPSELVRRKESSNDTIAIGLLSNNELVIAGNCKQRLSPGPRVKKHHVYKARDVDENGQEINEKFTYTDFGLRRQDIQDIIKETMRKSDLYRENDMSFTILEEPPLDDDVDMKIKQNEHAANHCELKILKYALNNQTQLYAIGTSKSPCMGCHQVLTSYNVIVTPDIGSNKVSNWRNVNDNDLQVQAIYHEQKD